VITGADHRAALHDADAQGEAELFPVGELVGVGPAFDFEVLRRGLKVLADGEDIGLVDGDVLKRTLDLGLRFAETEHDAGLGGEAAGFGVLEDGARAFVAGLDADGFLEALDGFQVVVKNVRLGVEDGVEVVEFTLPIGREDFDGGLGVAVADGADGGGPDGGAAVGEFVSGDGSDHAMAQAHFSDGISNAGRFAEVEFRGAAGLDGAEITGARADVAEDHHGGGAAGPAFPEVGTLRALADGVEFVFIHERADGLVAGAAGEFGAEPGRFTRGVHE